MTNGLKFEDIATAIDCVLNEENNFSMGSKGQITLTNVGWMKDIKYAILIFSSTNTLCDSITKTA